MIYRIHHDESYLMHVIPPVESMNKLGVDYGTFAFNAEPKSYIKVWKPLHIEFRTCERSKANKVPDISENFGRLFLSVKAHEVLKEVLDPAGEFLPVTYDGGQGFIFNPLLTAEELQAVDENQTTYDAYGNLEHFGFIEDKLQDVAIFKTALDTYKGIICSEAVKEVCNNAELYGVTFYPDVSNPIGEAYGRTQ